jgi:hypothetical protein
MSQKPLFNTFCRKDVAALRTIDKNLYFQI